MKILVLLGLIVSGMAQAFEVDREYMKIVIRPDIHNKDNLIYKPNQLIELKPAYKQKILMDKKYMRHTAAYFFVSIGLNILTVDKAKLEKNFRPLTPVDTKNALEDLLLVIGKIPDEEFVKMTNDIRYLYNQAVIYNYINFNTYRKKQKPNTPDIEGLDKFLKQPK